jgi:hypothetical protein
LFNIEEYEKQIKNIDMPIIKVLRSINDKYGPVAMISGGFSLLNLTKTKQWKEHSDNASDYIQNKYYHIEKHKENIFCMSFNDEQTKHNAFYSRVDMDICIIVHKQIEICKEICKKLCEEYKNEKNIYFIKKIAKGLFNIYEKSITNKLQKYSCIEVHKHIQLILKDNCKKPNDIFCLFDLDCCKIGYFPGKISKVIVNVDFIRSITTFINYAPFCYGHTITKHKTRIIKYYLRTGIRTHIGNSPFLSYYHTLKRRNNLKIKRWGPCKNGIKSNYGYLSSGTNDNEFVHNCKEDLTKSFNNELKRQNINVYDKDWYANLDDLENNSHLLYINEWEKLLFNIQEPNKYFFGVFGLFFDGEKYVFDIEKLKLRDTIKGVLVKG